MKLTDNWFSTMAEADNEMPIFVSGRDNIDEFRLSGKFKERVEIYWKYESNHNGMPSDAEGELMEQVIDALRKAGIQEGDTVIVYDVEFDFVD